MRIVNPYVKYSYERMVSDVKALKLDCMETGRSTFGKSILVVRKGNTNFNRKVLCLGSFDGSERIVSAFLMMFAEMQVEFLKTAFYIIPMPNPDGNDLAIYGRNSAYLEKIKDISNGEIWHSNGNGVELNMNFPCLFEERYSGSKIPANFGFKGYEPASESEVKAIISFCERMDFDASIYFYAGEREVSYADSYTDNIYGAKELAEKLVNNTNFRLMPCLNVKSQYGASFECWFRYRFKKPSISVGIGKVCDERLFDSFIWDDSKGLVYNLRNTFKGY